MFLSYSFLIVGSIAKDIIFSGEFSLQVYWYQTN